MSLSLNEPFSNDPWNDIKRMQRDLDRLLGATSGGMPGQGQLWRPSVDLKEQGNQVLLHMELPGLKKNDINIELRDNTLTISGERKYQKKDENERCYRLERSYGKFSRSFTVPQGLKENQIQACFNDGVLEVQFPKPQNEQQTKKITIG